MTNVCCTKKKYINMCFIIVISVKLHLKIAQLDNDNTTNNLNTNV